MSIPQNPCYNCFAERPQGEGPCPFCGYDPAGEREKYPMALPHGSVLNGQYIVGRVLGQGGFGITYLAWDHVLQAKAAVKEFLPEGMATRAPGTSGVTVYSGERQENFTYGAERFLDEARVLAKFTGNRNIAAVRCFFNENNTAYFAMDYIEGVSFKSYIANHGGHISWEDALRILTPVLRALSDVHREGIIHRDVTPDNIYITRTDEVKLLDFGSARYSLGDKSKSLDVVLKAGYAPKEQYVRRGRQGPYTDIYSVAACFYAALTGYLPPESLERMEEDTLVPPSTRGVRLPAYGEEAILKGLEVNAADRFQTADEFLAALYPASQAGPVPAAGQGMPAQGMPMQGAPLTGVAGQRPAQGVPMQGAPLTGMAGQMPAQGVPVQGAPLTGMAGQMPAQGIPMQGAPVTGAAGRMPAQGVPVQGAPLTGVAGQMPAQGVPVQGAPLTGVAGQMPAQGMPMQGAPIPGAAGQMPAQGMPMQGGFAPGVPVQSAPNMPQPAKPGFRFTKTHGIIIGAVAACAALVVVVMAVVVAGVLGGSEDVPAVEPASSYFEQPVSSYSKQEDSLSSADLPDTLVGADYVFNREYVDPEGGICNYTGDWKNDMPNGQGVGVYPAEGNKASAVGTYTGSWVNGYADGLGKMEWANGDFYEGEFSMSELEGEGTYVWSNGDRYEGQWRQSQRSGTGSFTFANGNKYTGAWKNDMKNGDGIFIWSEETEWYGDRYEGSFVDDLRSGYGIYYYADGDRYEGNWVQGDPSGYGVYYYSSGARYEGDWAQGNRSGQGTMRYSDGIIYTGAWQDDVRKGQGTLTWTDGSWYEGLWEDDRAVPYQGTFYYADGTVDDSTIFTYWEEEE